MVVETSAVLAILLDEHARGDLRDFLEQGGLQVEPVTAEQAELGSCTPSLRLILAT